MNFIHKMLTRNVVNTSVIVWNLLILSKLLQNRLDCILWWSVPMFLLARSQSPPLSDHMNIEWIFKLSLGIAGVWTFV